MNNLLDSLFSFYNHSLKKDTNYDICLYLLENLNRIEDITLKDITTNCFTSTTTVNKFCQLLGFLNFNTFKAQLRSALYMKKIQITGRISAFNVDQIYETYKSLCHDENVLAKEDLINLAKNVASLINQSDKVAFYASVYPLSLISNFQYDMCMYGKLIKTYYNFEKEEDVNFTENDMLIIVSYTGTHITTRSDLFKKISFTKAKKIIISQRDYDNQKIENVAKTITLPNKRDCVESNYLLMLLFDLVRYYYIQEYCI